MITPETIVSKCSVFTPHQLRLVSDYALALHAADEVGRLRIKLKRCLEQTQHERLRNLQRALRKVIKDSGP